MDDTVYVDVASGGSSDESAEGVDLADELDALSGKVDGVSEDVSALRAEVEEQNQTQLQAVDYSEDLHVVKEQLGAANVVMVGLFCVLLLMCGLMFGGEMLRRFRA